MTEFRSTRRVAILAMVAAARAAAMAAPVPPVQELPGDSIYRLDPHLVDQSGHVVSLASMRGAPVIASMFYSSCDMVCPLIFETIKQTRLTLAASLRERVKVLMVSFDPARDSVQRLKETADEHGCDWHWTLARASEPDVRQLAAVLGIQFRQLPSGAFNHSTAILVLDAQGRIAARSGKLGEVDTAITAALDRLA
jgi:protein SCO1